ncbi:hypothetical protein H310_03954 [Aphanomyces invadans]|uniref:Magnesium transporter n=1 Tax=Aphanomyces invadans TaxID=157072 RepID=A0A024UF48_9STRA|nr:hypothetical protein H310_03954 [Aphanomyces invadans]ETW04830.1 hypothetical protein H310_03954 [Aphanomyces invadans]|eukprot:XP_008866268.1 hypothetical protein H310_03954 [Aphanomyces invadans]
MAAPQLRLQPSHRDIVGGVLAVAASVVSNFGVNVQKYSHTQEQKRPVADQRPYIFRPVWWVGLIMVIVGSIGDFAAFGFATQALVAALGGGSTLIANVIIANQMNQETLYRSDLLGVLLVIAGVVVISVISEPDITYPLPVLEQFFARPEFLVYISCVVICVITILAKIKGSLAHTLKSQIRWSHQRQKDIVKRNELRFQDLERRMDALEEKLLAGQEDGSRHLHSNVAHHEPRGIPTKESPRKPDAVLDTTQSTSVPFYYATCSGIVGAISVLLAKCSVMMIALTIEGQNQFKYPVTYLFVGGMITCILIQTHLLNMATSLGDTMTVFPVFQAFWITFSVVGGIVFYDSEREFTLEKWVLYPLALSFISLGVYCLMQHPSKSLAASTGPSKEGVAAQDDDGDRAFAYDDRSAAYTGDDTTDRASLLVQFELDAVPLANADDVDACLTTSPLLSSATSKPTNMKMKKQTTNDGYVRLDV